MGKWICLYFEKKELYWTFGPLRFRIALQLRFLLYCIQIQHYFHLFKNRTLGPNLETKVFSRSHSSIPSRFWPHIDFIVLLEMLCRSIAVLRNFCRFLLHSICTELFAPVRFSFRSFSNQINPYMQGRGCWCRCRKNMSRYSSRLICAFYHFNCEITSPNFVFWKNSIFSHVLEVL